MSFSLAPLPPATLGEPYSILLKSYLVNTDGDSFANQILQPPYVSVSPNTGNWLTYNASTGYLGGTPQTVELETVFGIYAYNPTTGESGTLSGTVMVNNTNAAPYLALIISEHNQKPNFMALVQAVCAGFADVTALLNSMPAAFNLFTAQGAQLDIVGQWIGQGRTVNALITLNFFGYSEVTTGIPDEPYLKSFGELTNPTEYGGARWYDLGTTFAATTTLPDNEYLTVLEAVIARNGYNSTIAELEQALYDIFGAPCYVYDYGTLSITVYIPTSATATQEGIVTNLDILPRPAGVAITIAVQ